MKKYAASFVIITFLVLSVLTAYNIRLQNSGSSDNSTTKTNETSPVYEWVTSSNNEDEEKEGEEKEDEEREDEEKEGKDEQENQEEKETSIDKSSNNTPSNGEENQNTHKRSEQAKDTLTYNGENNLLWPLKGNIILPYSMDTTVYFKSLDQYACNDGLLLEAAVGTDVVAAADGRVMNITETNRYGTMVTILLGNYYEITYGQVTVNDLEIGDEVKKGETIAQVAEPTHSFVEEGSHLYMKMTLKGEPVNPALYLAS